MALVRKRNSAVRMGASSSSPIVNAKNGEHYLNHSRPRDMSLLLRILSISTKLILVISFIALVATAPAAAADVTEPVGTPTADECIDQVDNDEDFVADDLDDGCKDNTPETETLTQAALMGKYEARTNARLAAETVFSGAYTGGLFEYLKCRRRSRVSFWCGIGWYFRDYIYIARIRVFNYVDAEEDETGSGYALRGWKLTMACSDRPNPAKCAKKRYHFGYP